MTATTRGALTPGPFFRVSADWLPTAQQLQEAGLPGGHLAEVRLDVVRITPAGKWHPIPPSASDAGCARVRRATTRGRPLPRRQAGLLTGLDLCLACTAQVRLRGRAGPYLDLTRRIIAARAWTQALELAAPDADWPACLRWTARTPFAGKQVLALLGALGGDPKWQNAQRPPSRRGENLRRTMVSYRWRGSSASQAPRPSCQFDYRHVPQHLTTQWFERHLAPIARPLNGHH